MLPFRYLADYLSALACAVILGATPLRAQELQPPPAETNWLLAGGIGVGVPAALLGIGVINWWRLKSTKFTPENFNYWDRGWLGPDTYAGGHDKLGHFYSNYVCQYLVTAMYEGIGFSRNRAILASGLVTFVSFNLVELVDGFTPFGWEYGDTVFNIAGQLYAMGAQYYGWDQYLHLKASWVPSRSYFRENVKQYQFLEDYNGQRFFLLARPAAFWRAAPVPLRYVEAGLYYESRGYRPKVKAALRQRDVGVAATLDISSILTDLWPESSWALGFARFFEFAEPSLVVGVGFDVNHQALVIPDVSLLAWRRW